MKNKLIYILALTLPLILSGCLRTYYPAAYHTSTTPMIFEAKDSSNSSSQYLSADLTVSKGEYENESIQLARSSYTLVHTRKYYNFNTRLFGYCGIYHVAGLENYSGPKSVFGIGGEFGTNINFKIKSLKIGLGITGGVLGEFGGYYNFRKRADRAGQIDSEQDLIVFLISVFPVVAYEFSETSVLSTQVNFGIPGILYPTIELNNNGYIYWVSWIPQFNKDESKIGRGVTLGFMMNVNKF
jgi:hypothetical protein